MTRMVKALKLPEELGLAKMLTVQDCNRSGFFDPGIKMIYMKSPVGKRAVTIPYAQNLSPQQVFDGGLWPMIARFQPIVCNPVFIDYLRDDDTRQKRKRTCGVKLGQPPTNRVDKLAEVNILLTGIDLGAHAISELKRDTRKSRVVNAHLPYAKFPVHSPELQITLPRNPRSDCVGARGVQMALELWMDKALPAFGPPRSQTEWIMRAWLKKTGSSSYRPARLKKSEAGPTRMSVRSIRRAGPIFAPQFCVKARKEDELHLAALHTGCGSRMPIEPKAPLPEIPQPWAYIRRGKKGQCKAGFGQEGKQEYCRFHKVKYTDLAKGDVDIQQVRVEDSEDGDLAAWWEDIDI
ncbi:hypothetical protein JHW43_008970 [Diplocarpon mali]|nr:hypothetical protein JHW43_008970 [Diplocarpon mali]